MKDTLIHQALFRYVVTVPPSRRTNALSQIFSQDFEAIVLRGSAAVAAVAVVSSKGLWPLIAATEIIIFLTISGHHLIPSSH